MQVALVGMCVYWGGGGDGRKSLKCQCGAVSLKLSMKLNTVCSLIWSYSSMIFQRLAFWIRQRVWGQWNATPCTLSTLWQPHIFCPTHLTLPKLWSTGAESQKSLASGSHHEDCRRAYDKSSCKSCLREVNVVGGCGVLHFLISWQEKFSWISARPIWKRWLVTRSMGAFWEILLLNFNANDAVSH